MPTIAKGPRLWLRKQGDRKTYWYIVDAGKRIQTGCSAADHEGARKALADYMAKDIARASTSAAAPAELSVIDVLVLYATDKVPKQGRQDEVGQRLQRLIEFFGDIPCDRITPSSCASYVRWRTHSGTPGRDEPLRQRAPVKPTTARRELEDLRSAINHAFKSRKLSIPVPVELPEKGQARERWLTPAEARRLVLGALGYVFREIDGRWRAVERRRDDRMTVEPLVRFILIGLRTGTRHDAIMRLGFEAHPGGGHFDLSKRMLHRRARGAKETKKRQPPAPIPDKLVVLLRYWKRRSNALLVCGGDQIGKRRRMDDPFRRARDNAGLGPDVTPHTLRHTCATWKVQAGMPLWDVAGFLGMTTEMVDRVYGHHAPERLRKVANA